MAAPRLLLPVVCLLVGVAAGIGAGYVFQKPQDTVDAGADEKEETGKDAEATTDFAELNNQFVVPVVRGGSVRALVVLSITLEVTRGDSQSVFSIEPRLRDGFLQVLFEHANMGGFDDNFTQAERMSILRQGLREVASKLLGPIVRDVLIVDIVRQEA